MNIFLSMEHMCVYAHSRYFKQPNSNIYLKIYDAIPICLLSVPDSSNSEFRLQKKKQNIYFDDFTVNIIIFSPFFILYSFKFKINISLFIFDRGFKTSVIKLMK